MSINEDLAVTLRVLAEHERDQFIESAEIGEKTGLEPGRVSDAIRILEDSGYVEAVRTMGNAPYDFSRAMITSGGRYEFERATKDAEERGSEGEAAVRRRPVPVGSPYGFTEEDWEFIDLESASENVIVVFGHQFKSTYYDTKKLTSQLQLDFELALTTAKLDIPYNLDLQFVPLEAGYGEHLFNQIARSIIASDIAIFETSDQNPNVMIEMGVALTWGVRVHPIRNATASAPPSHRGFHRPM